MNAEKQRLQDINYRTWGPYVSNRQWGNVREDYSFDGNTWGATGHDDAESRTYQMGRRRNRGNFWWQTTFVLIFLLEQER